jgi:GNAT superfamily N-acetyltransferase
MSNYPYHKPSPIPHQELQIRPLSKKDILIGFNCGDGKGEGDLNEFLIEDAISSQNNLITRTYLCFWNNDLVGFITLLNDTIGKDRVEDGLDNYEYGKYPAIKIARLAVQKEFRDRDIGTSLLYWALGKVYEISKHVGCRYVTVNAKRESIGFYTVKSKLKFKIVKATEKNNYPSLYLNMYPIITAMQPRESLEDYVRQDSSGYSNS